MAEKSEYAVYFDAELVKAAALTVVKKSGCYWLADDCVQEALCLVWSKMHSYDPSRSFKSWAFTVVTNRLPNFIVQTKAASHVAWRSGTESEKVSAQKKLAALRVEPTPAQDEENNASAFDAIIGGTKAEAVFDAAAARLAHARVREIIAQYLEAEDIEEGVAHLFQIQASPRLGDRMRQVARAIKRDEKLQCLVGA